LTTTIDSSVLSDILIGDPIRGLPSSRAVEEARRLGRVVVPLPVWTEVRARFPDDAAMHEAMTTADLHFDPSDRTVADLAGALWRSYRRAGGKRDRVIADFMIAAHALTRGGRLLTRDRGFYRAYFGGLQIVEPAP
jgi:predicted nucleic acid-binding protein